METAAQEHDRSSCESASVPHVVPKHGCKSTRKNRDYTIKSHDTIDADGHDDDKYDAAHEDAAKARNIEPSSAISTIFVHAAEIGREVHTFIKPVRVFDYPKSIKRLLELVCKRCP